MSFWIVSTHLSLGLSLLTNTCCARDTVCILFIVFSCSSEQLAATWTLRNVFCVILLSTTLISLFVPFFSFLSIVHMFFGDSLVMFTISLLSLFGFFQSVFYQKEIERVCDYMPFSIAGWRIDHVWRRCFFRFLQNFDTSFWGDELHSFEWFRVFIVFFGIELMPCWICSWVVLSMILFSPITIVFYSSFSF